MRDRRNTNLSTCSASSCDSTTSSSPSLSNEKDFSPLPSPTLPLPNVTKENSPKKSSRRYMAAKALAVIGAIVLTRRYFLVTSIIPFDFSQSTQAADLQAGPAAISIQDQFGVPKWTTYIPQNSSFPLSTSVYDSICSSGQAFSQSIKQSSRFHHVRDWSMHTSNYHDSTFLDAAEAERTGVRPQLGIINQDECQSSLTFVLGEDDISLGKTLLLLWMSYGLAKKQGRAFFIDDTKWAYGTYTTYFTPLPSHDCVPAPRHHITPCPRNARHLLISPALSHWTFDASFNDRFSSSRRHDKTFDLIRTGYDHLFHLSNTDDTAYAENRINEIRTSVKATGIASIGIHIRRGDLHPYQYQFSRDYLPLEHYADAASSLQLSLSAPSPPTSAPKPAFVLSSDDPTLLSSADLSHLNLSRPQSRILLATKATLDASRPVTSQATHHGAGVYSKYRHENSGWDGGFYPALFYSTGSHMPIRELVGRAYLLDLKVMGEASDGVVCAVSSGTCRLLGVMMGKRKGRWVNVDDARAWSWDGRRWWRRRW